jgi:NADH-quinone oxidoreductase subunit E
MVIEQISDVTGIPASEIYGVITFYRQFRLSPPGKHILRLCKGTACHVQGVKTIGQLIEEELGISAGDTTKDGVFSYEEVACLGCCSLAPVMMIDDNTYGRLTAKSLRKILRSYRKKALQISA